MGRAGGAEDGGCVPGERGSWGGMGPAVLNQRGGQGGRGQGSLKAGAAFIQEGV